MDPERTDLMYPFINMALSAKTLDSGRDDYFRTGIGTLDLTRSAFVVGPGRAKVPPGTPVHPLRIEMYGDIGHTHSH